jgi:TolA-binding protein
MPSEHIRYKWGRVMTALDVASITEKMQAIKEIQQVTIEKLQGVKEELQAIQEKQQVTHEKLQEKLQAMNEKQQATNEQLQEIKRQNDTLLELVRILVARRN